MRDQRKHFPVNWIDGMKINKSHFIEQDNASMDALHELASLNLSPLRYGVLPPSSASEDTFNISVSLDKLDTLRVSVNSCQAITSGGIRISLPLAYTIGADADRSLTVKFPFSFAKNESVSWVFLFVHPFEKQAAGSLDLAENPPRYPNVLPTYTIKMVSESEYTQYSDHPYAIPIGRIIINGNEIKVDDDYIPPCFSLNAHPGLISLHGRLYGYLTDLEADCSKIIQNILKKEKQNEVSELVLFLCDRMMLCLAQVITSMNWNVKYEPPSMLFANISTLSRVMINTIDLRTGSGKEELMNYLAEWSPVKLQQGELETLLKDLANAGFSNNDINKSRQKVLSFSKIIFPLFEILSKQEFLDPRRKIETFVKEDKDENKDYKPRPHVYDRDRDK